MSSSSPLRSPALTGTAVLPYRRRASARHRFLSLRARIVLAMVGVAFVGALISGIVYQRTTAAILTAVFAQLDANLARERVAAIEQMPISQAQKDARIQQALAQHPYVNGGVQLTGATNRVLWLSAAVAVGAAFFAFAAGMILTQRIVGPLERLRRASQQVAANDLSLHIAVEDLDEVGQVTASFNAMVARLRMVEATRRDLLSAVAHEFKTPLASIQGHIEALQDNLPRATADRDAIYAQVLDDVRELDRLVGSLRTWLNAQRLGDSLAPERLALDAELPTIVARFVPQADAAGVRLMCDVTPDSLAAYADREALRHIVTNLLENALRYTPAGGQIALMAWPGAGEQPGSGPPGWVTLAVADSGCGIAPEHWPYLFDRFYRVDRSRSRESGGTGLGLAIVRALAEAHGGRVWLQSAVGRGACFFITLPAA